MTTTTSKCVEHTLPRSFYDVHCSDCDAVLGFVMKKTVVKLDPGSKQQTNMDSASRLPSQPLLEDVIVLFRNQQPSAVAIPVNKPTTFAEAITKDIETTTTSKSP